MNALLLLAALASAAEVRFELPAGAGEPAAVTALAFSPDGKALAAGASDGSVRLYSAADGRELWRSTAHAGSVWGLAFSPDGRVLASAGEGALLRLHDPRTGAPRRTIRPGRLAVSHLAFLPDGRLAGAGDLGNLELWDPDSGVNVRSLTRHDSRLEGLAVSPDGRYVATSSRGGRLFLWDAASGRPVLERRAGRPYAYDLAFAPDGRSLFARDRNSDALYRVDVPGGGREERLPLGGGVEKALAVPGSGLFGLAVSDARGEGWSLELFDPAGGPRQTVFRGRTDAGPVLAFSPDGRLVASAGGAGRGVILPTSVRAAPVAVPETAASTEAIRAAMELWSDPGRAEADFDARRRLYAESEAYDPYGESVRDGLDELRAAAEDGLYREALDIANGILAAHPVITEAHGYAATACFHLGDPDRAAYHRRYARGLVDSVRRSGDGRSPATAYKLVHMAEAEAVASTLSGPVLARTTLEAGGRRYDAWRTAGGTLYLDVTAVFDWSLRRFGGGD